MAGTEPTTADAVEIRWTAPPSCPGVSAVREAVDTNLGRSRFGPDLAEVVVEAAIEAQEKGWTLSITVELPGGSARRSVSSEDCAELADAAGLIIAVALDPIRVGETLEVAAPVAEAVPRQEPPAPDSPPREPTLPPTPPPEPVPQARTIDVDLRAAGVLEFGSLSVLRPGAGAAVGVAVRSFRVEVYGQYWAPRRIRPFADRPDAGVSVQRAGLGVRGCVVPQLGAVGFGSCVGFEGGASWGRGVGLGRSDTTPLPWAAAVAGQEVAWISRRRVGVFAGADAMLHVVRPRFGVEGLGTVAQTRWVGLRVLVGPVFRL